MNEVNEATKIIASRIDTDDYNFVHNLVIKSSTDHKRFLLHGDCGVHNFIFNDSQLRGVIDPTPVIEDPIYDLIYAFCSSLDDLTKETLDSAVRHLIFKEKNDISSLYELAVVCLYLRMATCIKHHPYDLEEYLKAWNYWQAVIKNI